MYNELVIGGNSNSKYLYHKISPDGNCFVNCYLQCASKIYASQNSSQRKSNIATKFRLDFANFLLSKSSKTPEKISSRLNILNPEIMATLLVYEDKNRSVYSDLKELLNVYDENDDFIDDYIYGLIYSYNMYSVETKEKMTYESIKILYERDHRINLSKSDHINSAYNSPEDPSIYGYGKIPIDICYYEMIKSINIGYDEFISSINTLINEGEYLTHFESNLIASYFKINPIVFQVGLGYDKCYNLIDPIENAPNMLMVNINNIHWNLVSFKGIDNEESLLLGKITDKSLQSLFNNLKILYNSGRLLI